MYTKLANSILTSTIWMESDQTRIVWLTLLAMADKNGEVQASIPGLANVARVPVDACRKAIEIFQQPDPDSRTKVDDGRRIEEIRGGWHILNHSYYRDLGSDEDRKKKAAERQRRYRERHKRNAKSVTGCDKSPQFSHTDTDTNTKSIRIDRVYAQEGRKKQRSGDGTRSVDEIAQSLLLRSPERVPLVDRIMNLTDEPPEFAAWWASVVEDMEADGILEALELCLEFVEQGTHSIENVGAYIAKACKAARAKLPPDPTKSGRYEDDGDSLI